MALKMTTEEWVKMATEKHDGRYDYSESIYRGSLKKIKIICIKHGEFEQRSVDHLLYGRGCPSCSGNVLMGKSSFIEKAKKIHGDKYTYKNVNYVGGKVKVEIGCPEHGAFMQVPNSHLNGRGCPSCAGLGKDTSWWINESRKIHGDTYDYSESVYTKMKSKIKIICKTHGEFFQLASNHINGSGCVRCKGKHQYTTAEWVSKASMVHGGKYDYSLTHYVKSSERVKIICQEHGVFEQVANTHLSGAGCFDCGGKRTLTTEEFVDRAKLVHGERYCYSPSSYRSMNRKVTILCKDHGEFKKTPSDHLRGRGCPRCTEKYNKPTSVYIMSNGEMVKVGVSVNPEKRLSILDRDQPFTSDIIERWVLKDYSQAIQVESEVHRRLSHLNAGLGGFDGATEWFNTTSAHAADTIKQVIQEMGL